MVRIRVVLGFTKTSLMVPPGPVVAPVIPFGFDWIDLVKVLATVAVKAIFGLFPLQTETGELFVTTGLGLTLIVILTGVPV